MKRIAVILLLGVYSMASFGLSVNSFYCCGKLKALSISLVEQKDTKCSAGATSSCCNVKHQTLKVHDSHTGSAVFFDFSNLFVLNLKTSAESEILLFANDLEHGANAAHAPPLTASCPLYIIHCAYRI